MKRLRALTALLPALFLGAMFFNFIEIYSRYDYISGETFFAAAIHALCWLLPIPFALLVLEPKGRTHVGVRDALMIAAVALVSSLAGQLLFGWIAWDLRWVNTRQDRLLFLHDAQLLTAARIALRNLHGVMLFTIAALLASRFLHARREERDRDVRAQRVEARLSESRLQLLRSQLNPHFLFNALNSVAALVRSDVAQADAMLARLSRFYRIAEETEGRQFVPVQEELRFVREYLEIESVRFGGRLSIQLHAAENVLAIQVPTLFLQPLVENAVKHGISRNPGPGWLRVNVSRDGALLRIDVRNSGALDGEAREGVGLANTRARLAQLYGTQARLALSSEHDTTRVTIELEAAA